MARRKLMETKIPKDILAWFNAELVAGGFSDYRGLTERLNQRLAEAGLSIRLSLGAVHNHGRDFQEQFEADMAESRQLYNVAKASLEDNEDPEGIIREATIRSLQTRLLRLSVALKQAEEDGDDPHLMAQTTAKIARAVADLGRADILSQKYKAEVRAKLDKLEQEASVPGNNPRKLDLDTLRAVRLEVYGAL